MFLTGSVIMSLMKNLPDGRYFDVLRLAAVVPSAALVYAITAKLLNIEMLSLITAGKNRQK
jgi:hypothetical protein